MNWLKKIFGSKKTAGLKKEVSKEKKMSERERAQEEAIEDTAKELELADKEREEESIEPILPRPEPNPYTEPNSNSISEIPVFDLRNEQPDPPKPVRGKRKWKLDRKGKIFKRDIIDIDTICIHQTAVRFSVGKHQIREAGGDRELALARRAKGIACHATAFYNNDKCFVAFANDVTHYIYHGNGFNKTSVGLEIDGDFAGLMSDPATAFRKKQNPDILTKNLRDASCRAIKLLVDEVEAQGGKIKFIVAHRQSSPTRRSDPGEQIWKEVVLDYAVKELGLQTIPNLIEKKGYTIPVEWDPNGVGHYWDDPER